MNENVISAANDALEFLRVGEPMTGVEWADKNFYLSPESSGVEGKWKTLPFQIGPLNWMCDDDIEEYNEMKSRRTGFTKRVLITTGYSTEHKKRNVVIWQPTDGDMRRFSKVEISTMIRDVPVMGKALKCDVGAKSPHNTIDLKEFLGATLDLKGGTSAKNYRAMTKDVAIYDELAAFDSDIDGEGSPTSIGDGRLDDSSFPKSIRGSTPKIKGVCLMEKALAKCKAVYFRYLPCPHCGHMHRLEFKNMRWENKDPKTTVMICPENGCSFDYSYYAEMDKKGRWQTLSGDYYDDATDCFHSQDGALAERPRKIGVRIWAAYSYFRTWEWVAEQWINAAADAKTGNDAELKAVINTILGETYEEKGESVDSTGLAETAEDYSIETGIPNDVLFITFGADVQGGMDPRIEVEILGHGLDEETWSLGYYVFKGDIEQPLVWDHLDEMRKMKIKRLDNVELSIHGGFIDSGYLSTTVYKYTGPRRMENVFATKGVNTGQLCNQGSWQGDKKVSRAILHTVNVDEAKTIIFNRLNKITEPGPGYCHFPGQYTDKYFTQLTNEEKKEKKKAGQLVGYEWVKKGPNEQLDCRAYNLGAFARFNPNLVRLKMRLEAEAESLRLNIPLKPRPKGRRVRSSGINAR
ncbi:MAG: phage terminase large subunit family protein [Proteobacteria bacterium]|nr:phage terminase large subunit family protein [Pseudomonadota bacterium]